ncbi:MAG TPA: HEAT repeat domain-containing protein [Gemmatimonadales bacterium]|nr:HEAT repeat domain-containing protein [Gemmatimonadales bacterium]
MTEPGAEFEHVLPPEQVEELLRTLTKASRAFQMYLPNNPMYHRAAQNLQTAFEPVWSAVDELVLAVQETDFVWEGVVVYHQLHKADSLAWTLYKDGLRVLTLKKGVEQAELPRLLSVINKVRGLAPDAADDLFTLLWTEEFQYVDMRFAEFVQDFGTDEMVAGAKYAAGASFAAEVKKDLAGVMEGEGPGGVAAPGEEVEEGEATDAAGEAGGAVDTATRPKGVVDLDEFDSTLYFLDGAEVDMLTADLKLEYSRDLREASLTALYDLFEGEGTAEVREEILGVLEALFPSMLNAGEFRASAAVLRETRVLGERAPNLSPAHKARLVQFIEQLSEPAIVSQLMQALDEGTGRPSDADITELLRELRPKALATLVEWTPRLTSAPVRALVEAAVQHLASAHQGELLRLLRSGDPEALPGAIELAGRLKLEGAVAGLGDVYGRADASLRLAATEALIQIGTPGALVLLERAIGDDDRGVRVAALKALSARGYKGALKRVEEVVQGKGRKDLDFNERRAFFEAYGAIAGAGGLGVLRDLIVRRGFFRRKQSADVRMCAALGLGKIGTADARAVLESVAEDNDRQVRNAVTAALRGVAE